MYCVPMPALQRQLIATPSHTASCFPFFGGLKSSSLFHFHSSHHKRSFTGSRHIVSSSEVISEVFRNVDFTYSSSCSSKLDLLSGAKIDSFATPKWRRVLLKISGEALAGDGQQNIDPKITMSIATEIAAITRLGIQVAIVVGGGNFFRGSTWAGASGLDRATADYIGMMATVMNAIFLQASMESIGIQTRVQTAFKMAEIAEPYIRRRAIRHLEKGRVVIFGAGTGNPFFTTDTAAALRAAEINAEVMLKATNVDGVFDSDPKKNPSAALLDHVSYREVTLKGLSVMDSTAISLCQENYIPVVVFNLQKRGNITKALMGQRIGTLIDQTGGHAGSCAEMMV
eukprot:c3025_g1_i1 orf=660-1685(-)